MQAIPFESSEDLGAACRKARLALGLGLKQAALAAGVNYRFASELENGKATAHIGLALRYATTLGLQLFYLPPAIDEPKESGTSR